MKNELLYPLNEKTLDKNFQDFKFEKKDRINELKILGFRRIKIGKKEYLEFLVLEGKEKYQYLYEKNGNFLTQKFEGIEGYKELRVIGETVMVIWTDKIAYCELYSAFNIDISIQGGYLKADNIDLLETKVRKFLNI